MFDLTQSCSIECFLSQLYYYFFHIFVIFSWRESFLLLLLLIFRVAYFLESIFVHMSLKSFIGFLLLGVNIYLLSASWLYFVLLFGGFHFRYTLKERGFIWLTRSSHFTPNLVLAYPWNATVALIYKPVNWFACGASKRKSFHKTFWRTKSKSIDWFLFEGNICI